jgi:hypothetical protein
LVEANDAKPDTGETVAVKVPKALVVRIVRRLPNTDFKTVDEYVSYVIEQVVSELEGGDASSNKSGESVFSKEDQASVEQRLRDLGYM